MAMEESNEQKVDSLDDLGKNMQQEEEVVGREDSGGKGSILRIISSLKLASGVLSRGAGYTSMIMLSRPFLPIPMKKRGGG